MSFPSFSRLLRGTGLMKPRLKTRRLLLRPFLPEDAAAVQGLCGNWNVARMLSRVPHPYTRDMAERWIASHAAAPRGGEEFVFCLELEGEAIGAVGLRHTGEGGFELGYWLGEPWWGKGFATEAARRAIRYAFEDLGADNLTSGHFTDNPASGRVLVKCGFRYTGETMQNCEARGEAVPHRCLEAVRNGADERAVAS